MDNSIADRYSKGSEYALADAQRSGGKQSGVHFVPACYNGGSHW